MGVEFVTVDSNMNEFLKQNHEATHTFRTLSIPLALQKLLGRYYFSSGTIYSAFKFDVHDTAYYDILSTALLTTENIKFESIGGESTRLEKLDLIADEDIVKKYLNVCVPEVTNCSKCHKCVRTILELYSLNKLDMFKNVFDVEYFYKNKNKYLVKCVLYNGNDDVKEVYKLLRKQKRINILHIIVGNFLKAISCLKKCLRKVLKRVKINDGNKM